MPESAWRSAWSCTGLFSRRTDLKPLRLRPPTRRRNSLRNSDVFKCRAFTAPFEHAHGCLDLCEDLRGPVFGSPLGRLTQNTSGSAPRHGDGRAATFLNVILLHALPEHGGENVDLCKICGSSTRSKISSQTNDPKTALQMSDVSKCRLLYVSFTQISSPPVTNQTITMLHFFWILISHVVYNIGFII